MKRCPQCNRSFSNSNTFCSDDGSHLLESDIPSKTLNITVMIFAAVAFGIAFGVTMWALQQNSKVSQTKIESSSVNNISPANSLPPTENIKIANSPVQTVHQPTPNFEVDVQIEYFTSTKTHDHPMPSESITIQVGGKSFNEITNSKGFTRFSNIPCGKQIKISFTGKPSRTFTRNLNCEGQIAKWRYYFNAYKEFNTLAIEQVK